MGSLDLRPHIEKFRRRFAEVEAALNDPKVFENNQRAQELAREYARLKDLVAHGENYLKTLADLPSMEVLRAKLLGLLNTPGTRLVQLMNTASQPAMVAR